MIDLNKVNGNNRLELFWLEPISDSRVPLFRNLARTVLYFCDWRISSESSTTLDIHSNLL